MPFDNLVWMTSEPRSQLKSSSQSISDHGASNLANILQSRNETLQSANMQAASAMGMAIFHSFKALGGTYLKANQDALAQAREKSNAQRSQLDAGVNQVHASIATTNQSMEEAVRTADFDGHILAGTASSDSAKGIGALKSPAGPFRDQLGQVSQRLIEAKPVTRPGMIAKNVGIEAVAAADNAQLANDTETAEALLGVATAMADVALGFIPIVGWGRDVFEAVSGQNLLTGEDLGVAGRSVALFGAVTLGFGDEFARAPQNGTKIIKALGKLAQRFPRFRAGVLESAAHPAVMTGALAKLAEHNPAAGIARAMDAPMFQLQEKFKHAVDFGVTEPMNKASLELFRATLNQHLADPAVRVIEGSFKTLPIIHFVNPSTGLNVMKSYDGKFVSGWKLSTTQLENVLKRGSL